MSAWKTFVWVAPVVLAGLVLEQGEARACGGCFVPPEESTQVTGHRMIMSIGMDQSTLYDQFEYSGDPESFAWVLPIKGKVGVGVSSDLVFNQLGFDTQVTVLPPVQDCPVYDCGSDDEFLAGSAGTGGGADNGGVNVIAQEVVGPYETVQLESSSPTALHDWLTNHGYAIPIDIQPVIGSYLAEGFNFLAVKLVPGEGVDSMQPIRITTPGSNVALPLRMVAAGTGATTTVTLYVVSEFRAETVNFPTFRLPEEGILWDYDQSRSNYTDLRAQAYEATKGFGWLVEAARPYSPIAFRNNIVSVIDFRGPRESGYGADWQEAHEAAQKDLDVLFSGMNEQNVWVTRLRAELSREAFASDLFLAASDSQVEVRNVIQTKKFIGTQPACPPPPPGCEEAGGTSGGSGSNDDDSLPWKSDEGSSSSCSMGAPGSGAAIGAGAALALVGLGFARRRRSRR